jgi:hypothetical protein
MDWQMLDASRRVIEPEHANTLESMNSPARTPAHEGRYDEVGSRYA